MYVQIIDSNPLKTCIGMIMLLKFMTVKVHSNAVVQCMAASLLAAYKMATCLKNA